MSPWTTYPSAVDRETEALSETISHTMDDVTLVPSVCFNIPLL